MMPMTLPNWLTLARIALIPVLMLLIYLPVRWANEAAALVFAAGAITDWLDGYLARRLELVSPFGRFLDPVADKLMVAAALIVLVHQHPRVYMVVPAIVIIGREITISSLREWMAQIGETARVAVSTIGKIKTSVQMVAILLLLYHDSVLGFPTYWAGVVLIYVATALTLWSMIVYLRAAWPRLGSA